MSLDRARFNSLEGLRWRSTGNDIFKACRPRRGFVQPVAAYHGVDFMGHLLDTIPSPLTFSGYHVSLTPLLPSPRTHPARLSTPFLGHVRKHTDDRAKRFEISSTRGLKFTIVSTWVSAIFPPFNPHLTLGSTCHARREFSVRKLQYLLSFKYI